MKLRDLLSVPAGWTPKKTVVPLAEDPEIIHCISDAISAKIATFILIGNKDNIANLAKSRGLDISGSEFMQETDEKAACELAAKCVRDGKAQIMMKGLVQTSSFSRAFLNKEYGLIPEGRIVSHIALFDIPNYHKLLIVSDSALNIAPGVEAKAAIIRNAIEFASKLGMKTPKVACIAPIEKINPKIQSTVDAAELAQMGREGKFGSALVEGPFGLDVAISKESAETKHIKSEVAGDADILLMPNLETANAFYKSLTYFGNARVASVIGGAKIPIVLPSRADTEESKLVSLALAAHLC